jgi:hypothetical protein
MFYVKTLKLTVFASETRLQKEAAQWSVSVSRSIAGMNILTNVMRDTNRENIVCIQSSVPEVSMTSTATAFSLHVPARIYENCVWYLHKTQTPHTYTTLLRLHLPCDKLFWGEIVLCF